MTFLGQTKHMLPWKTELSYHKQKERNRSSLNYTAIRWCSWTAWYLHYASWIPSPGNRGYTCILPATGLTCRVGLSLVHCWPDSLTLADDQLLPGAPLDCAYSLTPTSSSTLWPRTDSCRLATGDWLTAGDCLSCLSFLSSQLFRERGEVRD